MDLKEILYEDMN